MSTTTPTSKALPIHLFQVTLVKWNEPYQKLASCDSSGIIFVWIKYEGRWSIELINDRNTQVTDFAWSHDGRMALICYQDGFVLVGSVAGQRYWSSMMNLDATISCGVWTPDDQQVRPFFGSAIFCPQPSDAALSATDEAQAPFRKFSLLIRINSNSLYGFLANPCPCWLAEPFQSNLRRIQRIEILCDLISFSDEGRQKRKLLCVPSFESGLRGDRFLSMHGGRRRRRRRRQ